MKLYRKNFGQFLRLVWESWRISIAIAVCMAALVLGFTNFRIFPFSNFPMFGVVYKNPQIYAVEWVDENGVGTPLENRFLFPMSRLYINESVKVALIKGESPAKSLEWVAKRIRNYAEANKGSSQHEPKKLRVVRLHLAVTPDKEAPYEITKSETIDESAI